MIFFYHSTGHESGDCLGGHLSAQRLQQTYPRIVADTMDCIKIRGAHLGFLASQRIIITKADNFFNVIYQNDLLMPVVLFSGAIAAGETKFIDFGSDNFFLEIERVGVGPENGMMRVEFPQTYNAPWARPNLPLGDTTPYYALVYMVLDEPTHINSVTAQSFYFSGVAATYQDTIENHLTEPNVPGWSTIGLDIDDTLAAGAYPLWLRNDIGESGPAITINATDNFGTGGVTNFSINAALKKWRVYGAYDGSTTGGALLAESNTLPVSATLTPPNSGTRTYRLRLVEQTPYGVESQNKYLDQVVTIDAAGADVTKPPAPTSVEIVALTGGRARVNVTVEQPVMGDRIVAVLLEVEGESHTIEVVSSDTYSIVTDQFGWGDTITATAQTLDSRFNRSAEVSDTATLYFAAGANVPALVAHRAALNSIETAHPSIISVVAGGLTVFGEAGQDTILNFDGATVLSIGAAVGIASGWTLVNDTVSGASTDYYEVDGTNIFLGDGTTRRVKIDTVAQTITAAAFKQPIDPQCPLPGPVEAVGGLVRFQSLGDRFRTWLYLDDADAYVVELIQQE